MQESNQNLCVAKLCEQSHLRRALLRKTRNIKAPDLQPGQKVAMWRWTKRGQKKRGAWVIGRLLSWDPSPIGKQAWVRSDATTDLTTAENFEQHLDLNSGNLTEKAFKHFAIRQPIWLLR